LYSIGREISATLDLSVVLAEIANRARHVLRARDVVLRLLEPDGSLPVVVAEGQFAEVYRTRSLRLGQGLTGSIAASGVAELVTAPVTAPRVPHVPRKEEEEARGSLAFTPLRLGERVFGILFLWRSKAAAGPFTQSDLSFMIGLSQQAAVDIENARLF